jgi:hypothetical protein
VYESEGLWCEVRSVFLAPLFHVAPAAGGTETRVSTINDDRIHRVSRTGIALPQPSHQ